MSIAAPQAVSTIQELEKLITEEASKIPTTAIPIISVIENLRNTGDKSYLFLRCSIELLNQINNNNNNSELLFHCITGCRHVCLQQYWNVSLNVQVLSLIRDFFFNVGVFTTTTNENIIISAPIRMACLNLAASFWKRVWLLDNANNNSLLPVPIEIEGMLPYLQQQTRHHFTNTTELLSLLKDSIMMINSLSSSLSQQEQQMQWTIICNCCSFLTVLIGEFSNGKGYNMSFDFHKKTKTSFEYFGLTDIFLVTCSAILLDQQQPMDQNIIIIPIVSLLETILNWDFGNFGASAVRSNHDLIVISKAQEPWRDVLLNPEFIAKLFTFAHNQNHQQQHHHEAAHSLRQVLLQLASISGPVIFTNITQQMQYVQFFLQGILAYQHQLSDSNSNNNEDNLVLMLDIASIFCRIVSNFQYKILSQLPLFINQFIPFMIHIAEYVLKQSLQQCQSVNGDIEIIQDEEQQRRECLVLVLEGFVLMVEEAQLSSNSDTQSQQVTNILSTNLPSLLSSFYITYLTHRILICALEESYIVSSQSDLDEIREEISSLSLEDEMTYASILGRLNLNMSLNSIIEFTSNSFNLIYNAFLNDGDNNKTHTMSTDYAVSLEQSRLLVLAVSYLLTDDIQGETPQVPPIVLYHIVQQTNTTSISQVQHHLVQLVNILVTFTEFQTQKLSLNPYDIRLSPLLSTTLLSFWNRWVPVYTTSTSCAIWSSSANDDSHQLSNSNNNNPCYSAIHFAISTAFYHCCYWPSEFSVLDISCKLLLSIAKQSSLKCIVLRVTSFQELVQVFCSTVNFTQHDLVQQKQQNSKDIKQYFQRIPYAIRGRILSIILIASCALEDENAVTIFRGVLNKVQDDIGTWLISLNTKSIKENSTTAPRMQEMACLSIELFKGIAQTSEITNPERISNFLSPYLLPLSHLMTYFAQDLTICESLLQLFRDYTESFIAILNVEQCHALFQSCATLLQSYSSHHLCQATRVVAKVSSNVDSLEEEQKYSDILCVIQLLIHITSKEFIDDGNDTNSNSSQQVTDIIFFGLSQILPLMTQGLLQYTNLCTQFFSLVGFMIDTYPDKACVLSDTLLTSLLDSMLFGISHVDPMIAKSSLRGIGEIAREHFQTGALTQYVQLHNSNLWNVCVSKLLTDVIFQHSFGNNDGLRLEAASMTFLALMPVVMDISLIVREVFQQYCLNKDGTGSINTVKLQRLETAFQKLVQSVKPEIFTSNGQAGRRMRMMYRKQFEDFVKEAHAQLICD